jgi:hypothetical protein
MLIVAIPKSASTSLMATLGSVYGRPATQDIFRDQVIPEGYSVISRYHSDARLITDEQARRWGGTDAFYKQHVLPVEPNREKLRSTRIVLLLRDPEEIVLAYRRAELAKIHPERPEFAGCSTEQEWLDQAVRCGLLQELRNWTQGWLDDPGEKLVIRHSEVTADTENVLRAIADFWGLPRFQGSVELAYRFYSRGRTLTGWRGHVHQFIRATVPSGWRRRLKKLLASIGLA